MILDYDKELGKYLSKDFNNIPVSFYSVSHFKNLYYHLAAMHSDARNADTIMKNVSKTKYDDCVEFYVKRPYYKNKRKNISDFIGEGMHCSIYDDGRVNMLYVNNHPVNGKPGDVVELLNIKTGEDDTVEVDVEKYQNDFGKPEKIHEVYQNYGHSLISGTHSFYKDDVEISDEIHKVDNGYSYLVKSNLNGNVRYAKLGFLTLSELEIDSVVDLAKYTEKFDFSENEECFNAGVYPLTEDEYLEMLPSKVKNSDSKESDNKKLVK